MLKPLVYISRKKMKTARLAYETYCQTHSLKATAATTSLAINTIRKYIILIEDINNKNKLSSKDRYYNNQENTSQEIQEATSSEDPIYNNIYNKDIYNINNNKEYINNNKINTITEEELDNNNINDKEVITNIKNKLLLQKLTTISEKYLSYLDDPTELQLHKTSLKDRAVIAGILLDKILLEHKQSDVIKNQSIIFNLFGNNKNLNQFIADVTGRQAKLRAKPIRKYEALGNN